MFETGISTKINRSASAKYHAAFDANEFFGAQAVFIRYLYVFMGDFPILLMSQCQWLRECKQGCRINFAARYRDWALPSENI